MRFLLALLLITWSSTSFAYEWKESSEVEALFSAGNITGTFVLYDTKNDFFIGYNKTRAETRFIPASTYKIPNTLIGLSTGAVADVDEVFPYDGKPQPVTSWERDMSLREAIKVSCVPVYQQLARRIGLERMSKAVMALDYGNNEIGTHVDVFWLEGPLKISPVEQTRFLARLAQKSLPLPQKVQEEVQEILLVESSEQWSLFAKTGTVARFSPQIGWWVGWVKKGENIYSFALNIELPQGKEAPNRSSLGKQCLMVLGIID